MTVQFTRVRQAIQRHASLEQSFGSGLVENTVREFTEFLAQLRVGEKIGRTIAQTTPYDGEQLARNRVQRIAAHAEGPYAETRGHDQGGTVAHGPPISASKSGLFMSNCPGFGDDFDGAHCRGPEK